jgi:type I restriction enzyme S subunit
MSHLPKHWVDVRLSELAARITKGTTPKTYGFSYTPKGIRFVKAESLDELKIIHSLCAFVGKDAHDTFQRSQLAPNDVLFTIAGTLGRVAVVSEEDTPANTNQAVAIIRLKNPAMSQFVALYLSVVNTAASGGRGTGLQNLNLQQVGAIQVPLPPLSEQRNIVAKLENVLVRSKRARNELARIPRLVERYKQSVITAAMRDEEGAPWPSVALGDIVLEGPSNGYSPRSGENPHGTLSLKLTATTRGVLDLSAKSVKRLNEVIPRNSKFWLKPGDILIQRANSLEYVGVTAIFEGPENAYIYPDLMMRIRVKSPIIGRWIWRCLSSEETRSYFIQNATGTAGNMPKINGATVRQLRIPMPPESKIQRILEVVDRRLAAMDHINHEAGRAADLVDRLDRAVLAKAFRGELVAVEQFG